MLIGARVVQVWAGQMGSDSQQKKGIFLFVTMSRRALRPTWPPVEWVPEDSFPYIHLVLRLRIYGVTHPLPHVLMVCCLLKNRMRLHSAVLS